MYIPIVNSNAVIWIPVTMLVVTFISMKDFVGSMKGEQRFVGTIPFFLKLYVIRPVNTNAHNEPNDKHLYVKDSNLNLELNGNMTTINLAIDKKVIANGTDKLNKRASTKAR